MLILAVDPGRRPGLAWGSVTCEGPEGVTADAEIARAALAGRSPWVVVERPVMMKKTRDPNDLIAVAIRAGTIARYVAPSAMAIGTVAPSTWKGGLDKELHHAKLARDHASFARALPHMTTHDERDAFALWLWARDQIRAGVIRWALEPAEPWRRGVPSWP